MTEQQTDYMKCPSRTEWYGFCLQCPVIEETCESLRSKSECPEGLK